MTGPQKHKAIVLLHLGGMSADEIARRLGMRRPAWPKRFAARLMSPEILSRMSAARRLEERHDRP
jgi:hypothetical protein